MVEETVYTAYSDSASVTLSCEVESTSPVSLVFDTADGTAGSTRVGTKTTATITLDVTAYEADRTYSCAVGSETSVGTTKLVVMELTQMSEITRGKSGSTTDLVCTTSWYDDLTHPTISWKKRSTVDGDTTPIFVPQAVTTPNSVANTFESKLSFTLNENVDNLYYLCEVEYEASEVANADDKYSSQTQIILYQITVTPQDAFEDSGDNVAFVCVATVASTTSLKWSSIGWDSSAGYVGYGTSLFTETYDAGKGQMTSTLTLNAVTTLQSTESIKCLDSDSLGIEATTSLVVVDVTVTGDTDVTNLEPATITCTFSGLLDDTVVTWSTSTQSDLAANELTAKYTVDTAAWTKGATVSDPSTMVSKLTIQRSELTSLTTATVYTCSINPSNNPFKGTQTITVSKPEIELENTIWDFISTEDAVITCTLSNILESATISWTTGAANTAVVDDTTNFVITPTAFNSNMQKSTLTIKSAKLATLTDTYFKCSAVVGEDTLSADATLNVFSVADSFEDTTNYKMYVAGATLTLTCTFTGGDLLSNIEWQKDGTALSDTSNIAGVYVGGDKEWESTLDLTSVEPSDGGSYSCVFKFKSTHEDITRSTNVVLFDFVDLESSYFSPKSMSVTFRGTFEPTVTWMVDSTEYDAAVNTNLEIVEAEWAGNEITFTLNTLEQSSYASFTLQAVLNFTPAETSETITSTTATVYKREFTTELPATATFGPEDSDGLPITFTCVAAGEDVTKFAFTWFIGETEIAASGTDGVSYTDTSAGQARTSELVITSNDQKYNGMLKCVATWTDTSTSISSMSDVDAIGASIDEYTFDTGSGEAILSCVVWGNTAPTSVSWTDADSTAVVAKADKYVIADEAVGDIRTYTLKIENLQFADQGVYTCTVEFDSDNTLTYETEVVKLSASFEPASPYFAHDGTVHFTCIYTGAATPDKVEWFKGDDDTAGNLIDPATTTADYTITSDLDAGKSMFTIISPTAADDTGDYTCKWTLPSGSVRNPMATMTVAVRSIAMDATTLSTDGNLALTCTLTSVETGTVKWYYKGTEVTDQSGMGATGTTPNWEFTYSITDVNPEDNAGSYKCELSFVDGDELSATTEVTIRKVSIIDSEGATMENYIASDSTVKLICMTEADEVPETVKWYKDGSETAMVFDGSNKIVNYNTIQLTDSIKYMSNITLKSFVYTDAGSYSCKATFTGDSSNIPESDIDVKYATVEPGEDGCVFVDYLSSQAKTITCTLKSMETTSGVMFTLPDGSAQAGVLGAVVASEGAVSMREGTLDLTGLTNENDGTYKCSFSLDGGGSVESQMQLTARKAVISHSAGSASNTVQQLATSSLTLTCRVSGSIKELKWLKDDTEMTMNTDYKSVDVTDDGSGDTVEAIKVTIGTSNANYKCQATYFDDQCSTEEDFSSDAVAVTVIQAVPTTQPLSATVTAGSQHTLTCVFPNAFSSQSYVIKWFADEQTIVEQSGSDPVTRGGKTLSTESAGGSITTSLAFADVAQDDGASFVCLIQWGNVAITSDPAVLTVRYLSVEPATTNVVTGEDAVFSCTFTSTADSPETPTVKLHKSSDDSEVVTAVSGVMTMSAVTDSNNGDYYCQATWTGGQTMKSDDVKLYVFTEKTGPASVVWGVKGNMAQFECQADGALQTDDGLGDVVTSSVAWSYKTPSGAWTSTTGVARYTSRTPTVSPTGVLSAKLIVTSLTDADESLMAKCEITYTTDTSKNFVGGTITSTGQTLSLASVTSFTVDNAEPIAGSTITFTCVATGSAEPDFSLSASGLPLQSARMLITSTPAVTASGNTYTQEFVVESKIPNTGGHAITCIADFGRANGKDTADVTVTTYFDCAKAKFRPHTGAGSVTPTINSDGSRTQTLTCPVATTSVKYSDPSPASITCTKTTGVYDDELGDCFKITPSQGETIKQSWNSISNYKICEADAEPGYSVAEINAILTTQDDVCGPFPRIECLRSTDEATKCTIDEDETNCSPTDSGFLFTIRVVYTTPSFDRTEPAALDTDSSGKAKKVRFWGCDGARRRRRGIDGSAFEGFLEYQQSNTTILNDADVREESKQESVYMVGIVTSCGVAMMTVLTLFLVLRRQKQVMLERSDSEEVLKA